MKTITPCLQTSDIEALLAGPVSPLQSQLWEEHFSSCESCRRAMASQVGDQQWWQEAEQSLKQHEGESLRDSQVGLREANTRELADGPESIEELLKLLGPTDDPQMLGRIGSYEVLGILGRGGMGVVFKAFDAPLNRFVAIKMLLPHLAVLGAARKRFAREGQAVAAVVDDHVMAIHCVDEWQGVPYLVMTYSRGVSLQKRLSDNGPLEVREILRIGMQAAKGLAAAHAQGIVHRDIKPANIFLDQSVERVQLMDFGLARAVDDASLTRSGTLAGTPQYMSPEQARAETVDHRSDLFSLGSVMYAMCTGHAPFRAESSYSVLRLITDKEPRPIREINPDVPEWLCVVIGKLMAKDASDRFASAQEVAELLEDCLAHVQQPTVKELPRSLMKHLLPTSGPSHPARQMQRFKRVGIGAWLLCGVGLAALMVFWMVFQDNGSNKSGQGESGRLIAAHANLSELMKQQKTREESIRQISYLGTVRQYARQEIKRTNTESVDEFVARCVGLVPVYDELPPYALSASRDFSSGVYRFTMGDINAGIPKDIKYMDWFIDKKKCVQLMGRDPGTCDAVVTNNREDIRDDREAALVRLDIAAFRPVKDILMSEVLTKAISEPGIPDVGGRPLWKLEPLNNKVGWKATFMFQQPISNPPGAKQILWHRVYWEKIGGELVIVRVDRLTVDGDENSTPQSVVLIDDYRNVCGRPVPFRIRFLGLEDAFVYGAELLVSNLKINDYVDVPEDMPIPEGTRVRNLITGEKFRQPGNKANDPTTDAAQIQGTWDVVEMQQKGHEPSEAEREIYTSGGYKIEFTKNKMIHSPDHSSMQYRFDTTKATSVLELLSTGKVIAKAIYELKGDELRICQGRTPTDGSDPKAPTSFDMEQAAPGEFPTLMILRRTKPIDPIAIPMGAAAPELPLLVEARKALQVCQDSLSWKQKFDMRVTNSYVSSQVGKVTIESRVRRDAPRMVESSLQTFDDKPKDHIRLDNWRLDDGEMFIGRTTTVGQKKLTGLMTIKGRQKASWRMFESSSSFAMEGHFPGNQGRTLMELLMESKEPDVRMEKIGDLDCLRISNRNDWGTMTVWIDAGPSRRLRQWESFKERGNRFADGRVGEDKDTANLESFSYFVEDIQYKLIDGIEIAVSCHLRSTSIPNGGVKQEASTEYRRTEIHLRPDFGTNNPFVGDFDNGARINDGDAFDRDAAFRWQDGKLTTLPNTKTSIVDESKTPALDHRNARSVVEAYVAAAIAGERKTVQNLTAGNPQEPEQLAKTIDSLILNLTKLDSLATKTVFVNSPDCPSKGIALTETLKWKHLTNPSADENDVRLRFELSKSDQRWSVTEIGIEAEELADKLLKKFLDDNPTAISVLPQGSTEKASGGNTKFLVLDCEEIDGFRRILGLTQLEELYINQFVYPSTDFKILKELPHLRKLTFSKWSGLSSDEIATITKSLPGVEVVEEENQVDRKSAR